MLEDGEEVKLGWRHPGRSRDPVTPRLHNLDLAGRERRQALRVVVVGSPNVNPGYRLAGNTDYPEIAADFARTLKILKELPCDVFLGARRLLWNDRQVRAHQKSTRARTRSSTPRLPSLRLHKEQIFRDALTAQRQALAKDKAH